MANTMADNFTQNMIDMFEADLKLKLSGQNKFVFPRAGTFIMSAPMFNQNRDLLIRISYNS